MEFFLNFEPKKIVPPVKYQDKIMLMGSCFTEHIGNALAEVKFPVLQNPNGILFGPDAVCKSLLSYIDPVEYGENDLFYLNETWNSWDHHSRFSRTVKQQTLESIHSSQQEAHEFLKKADWLVITLGSSFTYILNDYAEQGNKNTGETVANCHRAPAAWFSKQLLETEGIIAMMRDCISKIKAFNSKIRIIFTISPVRHVRDGIVENNRSKARLIEAVHEITANDESCYYFPAYELVIDVLRDYRFYDVDLVHPNYAATAFVFEKFTEAWMDDTTRELMEEVRKIVRARKHKAFQPETKAHQDFLKAHVQKAIMLSERYPFLDLKEEIAWLSRSQS